MGKTELIEQKTVYVVLIYSMMVPEDMTSDLINEAVYEKFEAPSDTSVRLQVRDYHDEDESEPWLTLDSASVGETVSLSIG